MKENEKEIINAKRELANLYLLIKMQKIDDVINIYLYNFIIYIILQLKIIPEKRNEIEEISKKSLKDLIEYIKNSLDIIIDYKLNKEIENFKNSYESLNEASKYEKLLQREEERIRKLSSIEITLKLQCEKFVQKIDFLEKEKTNLQKELVRINYK